MKLQVGLKIDKGLRSTMIFMANFILSEKAAGTEAERTPTFSVQKVYAGVEIGVKTAGSLYLDGIKQGHIPAGGTARLANIEAGSHSLEMRYEDGYKYEQGRGIKE